MARFTIDGKVYTLGAVDDISLKDLVLFNTQAADMGLTERWNDVERVATEINALTPEQAESHPDKLLMTAVTIWVARRLAGDDLSFGDAIDLPLSKVKWIADPGDKKAKTNPTKPRKPQASAEVDAQLEPDAPE